tara:strand:+ start:2486 stop:3310 length:825 start_codon:yes stop_codon:yes gene_type:complete
MLDIDKIKLQDLDETLFPINDPVLKKYKQDWLSGEKKLVAHNDFIDQASAWFLGTKINELQGLNKFTCVDIIMGCTHFIESTASKHKWNIQILPKEYAYYGLMGKQPTEPGNLKPGVPLMVSMPNWYYGDRPDWEKILSECEQKNIDIHIDCAWLTVAKDFKFDFDHPNIKSIAMSLSKYNMTWNRVGLRWTRQRPMDSCTIISSQKKYNELTTAYGSYFMDKVHRDHGWNMYGVLNKKICNYLQVNQTMFSYLVKDNSGKCLSIGKILGNVTQ